MTDYFIKCACDANNLFSIEGRLKFENLQEAPSPKEGIRFHNPITAFFLRIFGYKKIVDIKDIDGKIYHLNRGSLSDWLRKNHDDLRNATKNGMLNVTEYAMSSWLNEVLAKKSPAYIVKIANLKNDLRQHIDQKKQGDKNKWDSIHCRELPAKIADIKRQLVEAETERLNNRRS